MTINRSVMRRNGGAAVRVEAVAGAKVRLAVDNTLLTDNLIAVSAISTGAGGRVAAAIAKTTMSRNYVAVSVATDPSSIAALLLNGNVITEAQSAFFFVGNGGSELIYTLGNNAAGFNVNTVSGGSLTPCCAI